MQDFLDNFVFEFGNVHDKYRNRDSDENAQQIKCVHK